jgi:protein TonB
VKRIRYLWPPLLLAAGIISTCAGAEEESGAALLGGSDAKPLPASAESAPASLDSSVELAKHPEYLQSLQRQIGENLRYPTNALRYGLQGVARIRIVLKRDGSVVYATLTKASGVSLLDKEAVEVVSRAGQFPPVPEDVVPSAQTFAFTMPVTFKLNGGN